MAVSGRKQSLTMSILQGSDEDMPVCSPCENGGNLIEAHGFCSNCKEHLCEACYTSHLRLRLFKNHVLLDKSKMPREAPPPDDMCVKHPDQQLEYFCKNHDKLECSKCVNIHHRTCEDVRYIRDICDNIEETKEFKALYRTLTSIEHDVVQNKTKATASLTDIHSIVNETKTSIRSFRKYLDQQLDKMEEELCKEVDDHSSKDNKVMEDVSDECNTLTSEVRSVIYNIDVARKTQQNMRLFITMKNTERIINGWQNQLHDIIPKNKTHQYKFEPEKRLQSMIGKGEKLGRLVMEDDTALQPDTCVAKTVTTAVKNQATCMVSDNKQSDQSQSKRKGSSSKCQLNTPQNMTAKRDDRINVKMQSDACDCYITGSVFTCYDQLAITDYWNKCVKMVDVKQKKIIYRLLLNHGPWDITRINEYTLAVSCPDGEYIQLLTASRGGTLTLGEQIQAGGQCYGIRFIDKLGGRLVVSFTSPHKVKIMDMSGTVLKDLSSNAAIHSRFNVPFHVTLGIDESTFIVSNCGNNTVTGLTLDGVERFAHTNTELVSPRGVAVGDGGEIYVCGWGSNSNIHVLSSEGRKIKVLLKEEDGVKYPTGITYCDNKLFVGSEYNNYVDVYSIQTL